MFHCTSITFNVCMMYMWFEFSFHLHKIKHAHQSLHFSAFHFSSTHSIPKEFFVLVIPTLERSVNSSWLAHSQLLLSLMRALSITLQKKCHFSMQCFNATHQGNLYRVSRGISLGSVWFNTSYFLFYVLLLFSASQYLLSCQLKNFWCF